MPAKYWPRSMLYEVMTIVPPHFATDEVAGVGEVLKGLCEKAGLKVVKIEELGKIKLAYPIDRQRFGVYFLLFLEGDGSEITKLDQNFRLSEQVMRHLVIARPQGMPTIEYKLVSYTPPLTAEGKRTGEKEKEKEKEKEPAVRAKAVEKAIKLTTEELATKLDQILDSDILKNI